jgi:hypothetical protein
VLSFQGAYRKAFGSTGGSKGKNGKEEKISTNLWKQ